ncbi:MAG TPA: hypothetical protein VMT12_09485 [Syntrophales bacterium]|nr:hypothetical protein [Syntrophales bacterium]
MKKAKKKKPLTYEDFFENPWCPLFGALPDIPDDHQYPNSVASRCLDIICEAREIWDAHDFNWPDPICPDKQLVEEKTGMPAEFIESVRLISWRAIEIVFNCRFNTAIYSDQYRPWQRKDGGESFLSLGAYNIWAWVLESEMEITAGATTEPFISIRKFTNTDPQSLETIQYEEETFLEEKAFSLLAIDVAWSTLGSVLYWHEAEDSPYILRCLQDAQDLMTRARQALRNEDARKLVENEAAQWHKDAENRRTGKLGGDKSGKLKREEARIKHKGWQEKADVIWIMHPNWNKSDVARRIAKEDDEKWGTIRRRISKPKSVIKGGYNDK